MFAQSGAVGSHPFTDWLCHDDVFDLLRSPLTLLLAVFRMLRRDLIQASQGAADLGQINRASHLRHYPLYLGYLEWLAVARAEALAL